MAKHESVRITTSEPSEFRSLEEAVDVDVAVFGGGIARLSTALLFEDAGLCVAVLEPGTVCCATTAHTTAKVSAQHGLIYDTLTWRVDQDRARAYAEPNLAATIGG